MGAEQACEVGRATRRRRTFTLVELVAVLVCFALIAVVCVAAVSPAAAKAKQVACYTNLKECGQAWLMFAEDNDGWILPALTHRQEEPDWPAGLPEKLKMKGIWWWWLVDDGYLKEADGADGTFHCPTDGAPVKAVRKGKTYLHSYLYPDYFGQAYGTNVARWPASKAYGLKRLSGTWKKPGETVVMVEAAVGKYKAGRLVPPSGGYSNLPHTKWTGYPHQRTATTLFEDGHVDAAAPEAKVLSYTCRDLF
ncbi:MAG: hypothetical protein HN742_31900 [Lentisphaerae bacterium]|jgi:type II secretory pathway pseudopilin PulG|nr:hypothetical protein [Lentisphaerota bacterium]MBT5609498.1 hypothetical protein [Lentisphaerota bacterium]MBT7061646.1 hypothetical protein [Lentisphaerota bacterium]MBT7846517.1 hypothetical protein [Lentisphaerota bacterium]